MSRTFDRYSPLGSALDNEHARAVLEQEIPDVVASPLAEALRTAPVGGFLQFVLRPDAAKAQELLTALETIEDTSEQPEAAVPIAPAADYEPDSVPRGSAHVRTPDSAERNETVEIAFDGPSHGNPFVEVELRARFEQGSDTFVVGGFYDGGGRYLVRFLPKTAGTWTFVTESNARSLDGIRGTVAVAEGDARGPVRVAEEGTFAYSDGTPFVGFGTTAYAWTHQSARLQDQTIESLAQAPFNKIRMGLFPKDYLYNKNEPENFVFPRTDDGWDTTRFDLDYFGNLERRITQLAALGIEADLILFHPYDRWGFSGLGAAADERYLTYVVRRLAGFANVWWSMANEYDLLTAKRPEDWHRLARVVAREDHVGHLLSIHNWVEIFDFSAEWATHASIQRGDTEMGGLIDEWRHRWGKPVAVDEFGYEGDLDQGWGNLTAEAVVQRFWSGTLRGGHLTHGETFWSEDEIIWWSRGGQLHGESPARIAFLKRIVAESPTGRVQALPGDWDAVTGGVAGEYVLIYFGDHRPRFRDVAVPQGMRAEIDIIDTWQMTITPLPGTHEGTVRLQLPARRGIALRLRAV